MSLSSEDESSESSSDEYLVSPDKINFDSSFFQGPKVQNSSKAENDNEDTTDSEDDFIGEEDEKVDSAALLAEVMKNLEKANNSALSQLENPSSSGNKAETPKKNKNVLSNEILDLLLQGESGTSAGKEEEEEDEEEKEEEKEASRPDGYTIPKEGVKITLPGSAIPMFKRNKKSNNDLAEALRRKMNQKLRSNQIFIHKVGLLCWLSHGFHLNREINDPELLSTALSIIPSNSYPKNRPDLKYLEHFTKWFKNFFRLEFKEINQGVGKDTLILRLREKKVHNYRELVLLYVATLRAMGINCRLVISFSPPALKLSADQLFKNPNSEKNGDEKEDKPGKKSKRETSKKRKKAGKREESNKQGENSKIVPENGAEMEKNSKMDAKKRAASVLAKFANNQNKKSIKLRIDKKDHDEKSKQSPEKSKQSPEKSKQSPEKSKQSPEKSKQSPEKSKEEIKSPPRTRQLRSRAITSLVKVKVKDTKEDPVKEEIKEEEETFGRRTRAKKTAIPSTSKQIDSDSEWEEETSLEKQKSKASKDSVKIIESESDSEEEFEPKKPVKRRKIDSSKQKSKIKSENRDSIDRRVLSSDDEQAEIVDAKGAQNIWVEVYLESEESWISVSVPDDKIHCVSEIYKKSPKPVLYILAWNSVGTLKDVTRRYCPHWLTVTRKQRVDENWWTETLNPWIENNTVLSRAEDEMLLQRELEQPLPKTVGECKGHPLYALTRHLLKFEALYPPNCVPLGHLKTGEAIYSRHCVHTLCSRETWIKKARVVKPKQDPYKIVKAMPKYDKLSGIKLKDLPLELFGKWQTTQYVPPEAKDGIVPRNEYGNVDLFKQCMLPKGTVHINLPALNRTARKLGIDCVAAVVGFNFGCRGALPALEGYVVCEEFEDTLREAWEADQIEAAKRAEEKREKRIYGNWKKLIKGLFIRERLAARYNFNEDDDDFEKKESASGKRAKQKSTETKKPAAKRAKKS